MRIDRDGGGRREYGVGVISMHYVCLSKSECHKHTHNPYIIVSYNTL